MTDFSARLLRWFDVHGRHDLPWQAQRSAYSVWVSEIMLQQTQVATVVPFFNRFIARFPDVATLAEATADEVLSYWAGLGYYARARNLHRASQIVAEDHDGKIPADFNQLVALPGIGRSTAGAILAIACGQRHSILDGNVKRVLSRHHGVDGWPGSTAVANQLWSIADAKTPTERVGDYTQAIMDLGATLCTRTKPDCDHCPVSLDCVAKQTHRQADLPARKPVRAKKPKRAVVMCVLRNTEGAVLLERRAPAGIWGGLYSFPEVSVQALSNSMAVQQLSDTELSEPDESLDKARFDTGTLIEFVNTNRESLNELETISHSFTHFDLDIRPLLINIADLDSAVMDRSECLWYKPGADSLPGVPAPVSALLKKLSQNSIEV